MAAPSDIKDMKSFLSEHRVAAISVISVIVLALITVFIVVSSNKGNVTEQAEKTVVGKAITTLIPEAKLGMYLTAPATQNWWEKLDLYNPSFELKNITLKDLPNQPTMLGWSVSENETNSIAATVLGLNTIYVSFDNEKDAEATTQYLNTVANDKFQTFTVNNMVVLIPTSAFSDVDYLVKEFEKVQKDKLGTVVTDKGYWTVNFATMQKIILQERTLQSEKTTFYENALKGLGFQLTEATKNSSWSGESKDGLSWTGSLSVNNLWKAADVNPPKLDEALAVDSTYILMDGSQVTKAELDALSAKADDGDIQYFYEPGAAAILEYLTLQTSNNAAGTLKNYDGSYSTPEPIESKDYALITINPNAWVSFMSGNDEVRPYTKIDKAEIKISLVGNNVDIILTPAEWA